MQMERIWVNGKYWDRPNLTMYNGNRACYRGMWRCGHPFTSTGIGRSPKEAYDDWLAYRVAALANRMENS